MINKTGNSLFICDALEISYCVDVICDTVDNCVPPGFTLGPFVVVGGAVPSFVTSASVSTIFVDCPSKIVVVLRFSAKQGDAVVGVLEYSVVLLAEAD